MKFYKSVVFGVSMLAVVQASAGGKDELNITHTNEKQKHLTQSSTTFTKLPSTQQLVENILVREKEESQKLSLIAGLFKDATKEMVKTALHASHVNQNFDYQLFLTELTRLREDLFYEGYLPLDMLNLIFKEANNYKIKQLLLGVDFVNNRIKSMIDSHKKDKTSRLPGPELLASYFEAELEKISKTVPQNDRPSKYQEFIELLSSLKIDEPSKIRILATRSPKTLEFIEDLVSIKCIDEPSKIRIFATKCITDPEFAEIVKKTKFSETTDEFIKKATPETVRIAMTSDLDKKLKALKSPRFVVVVTDFDKNKIEKLLKNENVLSLNLYGNYIRGEGAKAIATALEKNKTLLDLNLRGNKISDESAKFLGQALEKNQSLELLDLSHNNIGHEGVKFLSQALETNETLKSLNLCYNKISDEGAKEIASALEKNSSLASLDLSWSEIGDEGAKYLGQGLEKNATLKYLDLTGNKIGDEGAKALAPYLEKNTSLTDLNLSDNNIGDEGAKALLNSLKNNTTLKLLDLRDNQLSEDVKSKFRKWAEEKGVYLDN